MLDGYKQYLTKMLSDIYQKYFINVFYNRYSEVNQKEQNIHHDGDIEDSF